MTTGERVAVKTFGNMIGRTITSIDGSQGDDEMTFTSDGALFRFCHVQDCCENVTIDDVVGDLNDLIGSPLLVAEEVSSEDEPAPEHADSYTWTFYRFATVKGTVTVRWLGESNGYYSEAVEFDEQITAVQP